MKIVSKTFLAALATTMLVGCGATVRNQTPSSVVRNASGIYPITAEVKRPSNAIPDKSVRTELIVWGEAAQMERIPADGESDTSRWTFSLAVPPQHSEVYYYFRVHYDVAKNFTEYQSKQVLAPPDADKKMYVLHILDRISAGLDSERGRVGSTISVLGKGFTRDDQIRLGGQPVATTFKDSSVLKFQIPSITPNQAYAIEVVGASGDVVKVGTLLVDIGDLAVSPSPITLVRGANASVAIRLPNPAPADGVLINLTASDAGLTDLPAQVTLKEGKTEAVIKTKGIATGSGTLTLDAIGFQRFTIPVTVVEAP